VPASSQEHALPRRRHNLSCCPGARSPGSLTIGVQNALSVRSWAIWRRPATAERRLSVRSPDLSITERDAAIDVARRRPSTRCGVTCLEGAWERRSLMPMNGRPPLARSRSTGAPMQYKRAAAAGWGAGAGLEVRIQPSAE
jgi:hypothetical protein